MKVKRGKYTKRKINNGYGGCERVWPSVGAGYSLKGNVLEVDSGKKKTLLQVSFIKNEIPWWLFFHRLAAVPLTS